MSSKALYLVFIAAVLIGIVDTTYLSLTTWLAIPPVCGPLHGCEVVAASAYSKLFGISLSYIGLAYYFVCACLISSLLTSSRTRLFAVLYGGAGALMSVWFVYIQAAVIHALCVYCLISAAAALVLFLSALFLWKKKKLEIVS